MTESDNSIEKCFNLLKRTPFEQLDEMWVNRPLGMSLYFNKEFFAKHSWTYDEYIEECIKRELV